jgi:hypothetical protein
MRDCSITSHCPDSDCNCHLMVTPQGARFLDPYCSHCIAEMYREARALGEPLPFDVCNGFDDI